MSAFSDIQRFVLDNFRGGEYRDIESMKEVTWGSDGLLDHLVDEAGDCQDLEDLQLAAELAIDALQDLVTKIRVKLCTEQEEDPS